MENYINKKGGDTVMDTEIEELKRQFKQAETDEDRHRILALINAKTNPRRD